MLEDKMRDRVLDILDKEDMSFQTYKKMHKTKQTTNVPTTSTDKIVTPPTIKDEINIPSVMDNHWINQITGSNHKSTNKG